MGRAHRRRVREAIERNIERGLDELEIGEHFRFHRCGDQRTRLYRSRNGMIFGVCRGIAEERGFSVFWTRVLAVGIATFTGCWPAIAIYLVMAIVIKPEPVLPLETAADEEFYQSYSTSRTMALQRLKRTYDNLDGRIQRIENSVTARDYDWERRLNS